MATEFNVLEPNYATHPGEMLAEYIETYHCEHEKLAIRLGITPKHLSNIVNCKAGITARTALALEKVFPGKSAESWLKGQQRYDLFCVREEMRQNTAEVQAIPGWLEHFNYDELAAMGYVPLATTNAKAADKASAMLKFFGCFSVSSWQKIYGKTLDSTTRQLSSVATSPGNALAWLRRGQQQASLQFGRLPRFDRREFARLLNRMGGRSSSKLKAGFFKGSEAFADMKKQCIRSGVMLISEPSPPSQAVQSALFWSRQAPCIQVNSSLDTEDEFWFGFACEAQRLLEANSREAVIDMQDVVLKWIATDDTYSWLIPTESRCEFLHRGDFSKASIMQFADDLDISAGVIVGWLQKRGLLQKDTSLDALKTRVEYAVVSLGGPDLGC